MTERIDISELFASLWGDYTSIAPSAGRIWAMLRARGEEAINDHIALRTFNLAPVNLEALAEIFTRRGYRQSGDYVFVAKKLSAASFSHADPDLPRVFISELRTELCSELVQETARSLVSQVQHGGDELLLRHPTWPSVTHERYQRLLAESEYAAWLSVYGLRANHFTIAVNRLKSFGQDEPLVELNKWLKAQGFVLNSSGGEIKGSPQAMLEQSSTMADQHGVRFAGGQLADVPSCYCEFAFRHPDPGSPTGLFDGFVTSSADKIFESTNVR